MASDLIRVDDNGVLTLTLSTSSAGTSLDHGLVLEAREALRSVARGTLDADAVLLRGDGKNFCAGGNVGAFAGADDRGDYLRGLYESLESGMGTVTNAYVASGDLIGAVEDSLRLIPAPVDEVFRKFLSQIRLVDASVPRALQAMKGQIDNRYWQEWVNTLIQCQNDRTLRYALPGIVERLGAMRRIRMEADTLLQKQIGDYVVTVFLLLGSIPVMAFMMPDWYEMLTQTIAGQITLAVVLGAVFATALWIGRLYHPKEGGGKA